MAESNVTETIEVIIKDQTSGGDSPVTVDASEENATVATPANPEKSKKTTTAALSAQAVVAVGYIKPYVQQMLSFGISQVEMTRGSAELQRKLEGYSALGARAISIGVAGAAGGAAGAIGAAGLMLVQSSIETMLNNISIQNRKTIENENIALLRSRAGLISNRSRGGGTI